MLKNGDFHDAKPAQTGQPEPFGKAPVGFWKIGCLIPFSFFDYQHFIAFFGQSQGTDGAAKSAANDDIVVCHVKKTNANKRDKAFSCILILLRGRMLHFVPEFVPGSDNVLKPV